MNPDWQTGDGSVQLFLGDCLDVIPTMQECSVNAILTDLPYQITACSWDTMIPFEPMWKEVKRVLKNRGVFVTTASQPFTSALVMSNTAWFRYEWIWEKSLATGYLNCNRVPMKAHEDICVFYNGLGTYNPQKNKGAKYRATSGAVGDHISDKTVGGYETVNDGSRFPRSVLWFNSEVETSHGTQKPVALYEYLTRTYTNEGDTVLDFCFGSCTTGISCIRTGRKFIGIEKDEKYFYVGVDRIKRELMQPRLPEA